MEHRYSVGLSVSQQAGLTFTAGRTYVERLREALIHRAVPTFRRREIRGIQVAPENLIEALYAYRGRFSIRAFSTGEVETVRKWLSASCRYEMAHDHILPLHAIRNADAIEPLSLWFEPGAQYSLAYQIRERFARRWYPITCTVHGLSEPDLLYGQFLRILLSETRATDSFVCTSTACRRALCNIFHGLSERLASTYGFRRSFQGGFDVIPLCVDTDRLQPGNKQLAKRSLHLPSTSTLLLYVGRLSLLKADLGPLLLVLGQCQQQVESTNLVVGIAGTAGTGFIDYLRRYASAVGFPQRRLFVFHDITEVTKRTLLQAADIFTSPSDTIQECFGLTPVETMAAGIPQIVSDWSGYKDTVVEGETGFKISAAWTRCDQTLTDTAFLFGWPHDHLILGQSVAMDIRLWRDTVFSLAHDADRRAQMGASSRKRAVSLYSKAAVMAQYRQLWADLIENADEKTNEEGSTGPLFERPHYFDTFSHFASVIVTSDSIIEEGCIDAGSLDVVTGKLHPAISKPAGAGALREILTFIKANGPSPLVDITRCLQRKWTADEITRESMWGLKYGFLALRC